MTPGSLWESITAAGKPRGRLHGARTAIDLADLSHRTSLGGRLGELEGCSVVLLIRNQLAAALTMLELDGVAARMVLCPPDLAPQHLPGVLRDAAADACVRDAEGLPAATPDVPLTVTAGTQLLPMPVPRRAQHATEWILLTSGTTGAPKLVEHSLASLTSALAGQPRPAPGSIVWSTFYDIRRYGGLADLHARRARRLAGAVGGGRAGGRFPRSRRRDRRHPHIRHALALAAAP